MKNSRGINNLTYDICYMADYKWKVKNIMSIVDPDKNKKKKLVNSTSVKNVVKFLLREIYIMLALLYIYIDTLIRDFLKNRLSYYNYVIY